MELEEVTLRIAGIEPESIVDGPGIRLTVFVQGCPHHCLGCHNPETHDFDGGTIMPITTILDSIDENPLLSGVTFSGGEPFGQVQPLLELAREVKKRSLHLTIFTGYLFENLLEKAKQEPNILELLSLTDLLVDGPFILSKKSLELQFRGSSNQRLIDVQKTLANTGKICFWHSAFENL